MPTTRQAEPDFPGRDASTLPQRDRLVRLGGLEALRRLSHARRAAADETILAENGPASFVGTVLAGVIRITKTLPDGRQQVIGLVYPGEFFGRPFATFTEFAFEAATDVELNVIERRAFEAALRQHPELAHELLLSTLSDLAVTRERAVLLGCQSTLERLATYLLVMLERREQLLADVAHEGHRLVAASAIGRRDLASYLSTTIETISRHLHFFSRTGVIRIIDSSHFEVLDVPGLLEASGLSEEDLDLFRRARQSRAGRFTSPRLVPVGEVVMPV
jgi:CRP/FNR family transcriptional regulator, anaerobic regulatory protein